MDTETVEAPVSGKRIQREGLKGRAAAIPIFLRVKARNLYLNQCLPYRAISEATDLSVETLQRLAMREGWTALRKQQKERIMKAADAGSAAVETEIAETVIAQAGQHTLRTMERIGESLERSDEFAAKDFQAYTAGAKNLVGVMKALRDPGSSTNGETTNFNLFFMAAPAKVSATEPKQVTEIKPDSVS